MPFTFFHISKAKRNGLLARKKSKKVILVVYVQIRGGGYIFAGGFGLGSNSGVVQIH